MTKDLMKWLTNVVNTHEQDYLFRIEYLSSGKSTSNWHVLNGLSYHSFAIAVKKLVLENNVLEYKKYMYKSGRYHELFILAERLNDPEHPRYVKGMNDFNSTADKYGCLYSALISQDERLIESLSHLIGWRGEEEDFKINDLNPELGHIGFIIKYIIQGNDEKAEQHIEKLTHMEWDPIQVDDMEQMISLFKGILMGDSKKVNMYLEEILEIHKNMLDLGILGKFHANQIAGLGWLAKYRGIDIEIDDKLCPKEIFESHEISYPEVEWVPEELKDKTWKDFLEKRY